MATLVLSLHKQKMIKKVINLVIKMVIKKVIKKVIKTCGVPLRWKGLPV